MKMGIKLDEKSIIHNEHDTLIFVMKKGKEKRVMYLPWEFLWEKAGNTK